MSSNLRPLSQVSAPSPSAPPAGDPADMPRRVFAPLLRDADGRWRAREESRRTTEAAAKIYGPLLEAIAAEYGKVAGRGLAESCECPHAVIDRYFHPR